MKILPVLLAAALTLATATAQTPLRIEGSNTFGEKLGPLLVSAFKKQNPDTPVNLISNGSGAGLSALVDGRTAIAPTSRAADADELRLARASGLRLNAQSIGSYGVVVILNDQNPVRSLTLRQVRDIFAGRITNWNQVGGPDARIRLFILDNTSGARRGFQELAMRYESYARGARAFPSKQAIADAVAKDATAIGYDDMGPLPAGTRAVLINGIAPNRTAINQGLYPYARTLYLYTVRGRETPAARQFIRFAQSRDGQRIISNAGFVPRMTLRLDRDGIAF
ncbi:MAG: phosphate ABC transporter substrate-binding protein [Chthoniobacterales bacterium]